MTKPQRIGMTDKIDWTPIDQVTQDSPREEGNGDLFSVISWIFQGLHDLFFTCFQTATKEQKEEKESQKRAETMVAEMIAKWYPDKVELNPFHNREIMIKDFKKLNDKFQDLLKLYFKKTIPEKLTLEKFVDDYVLKQKELKQKEIKVLETDNRALIRTYGLNQEALINDLSYLPENFKKRLTQSLQTFLRSKEETLETLIKVAAEQPLLLKTALQQLIKIR